MIKKYKWFLLLWSTYLLNFKYFLTQSDNYTISKQEICIIILIFVIAFTIRAYDLGKLAFNNDEAIYSGQAASLANYSEYQEQFSIFRAHPLLLQFMISISFYFFGINEFTARIVPVFFCVVVLLLYLILLLNFYTTNKRRLSLLLS